MGKKNQVLHSKKFFVCKCCGKNQNIDQSVHISLKYCVSCYNKEQIYRSLIDKVKYYIKILKLNSEYTERTSNLIKKYIKIAEVLLPQSLLEMEDEQVIDLLHDRRKESFKKGLDALDDLFGGLKVDKSGINDEWIDEIRTVWKYKSLNNAARLEKVKEILSKIIDISGLDDKTIAKIFLALKKNVKLERFTGKSKALKPSDFVVKKGPVFFDMSDSYIKRVVRNLNRKIQAANSQKNRFKFFIEYIGEKCQFQTARDALKNAIEMYINDIMKSSMEFFYNQIKEDIDRMEDAPLIPNIAMYIMKFHEHIFSHWLCKILPLDRSRFSTSHARTGSRTDFIVKIAYVFNKYELKVIEDALRASTPMLIRNRYNEKIERYKSKQNWSEEKKEEKIREALQQMEEDLKPERLQELEEGNAQTAPMVARLLLINSEKSFNMILNRIIQSHYKRLKIRSAVSYITNVLESGAEYKKTRKELDAYYLIHSREW